MVKAAKRKGGGATPPREHGRIVKGILARTETLPVHLVVARGAGRRGRFLYSSSGHRVSAKGLTHRMREAFFADYDYEKGDRHRAWIEADGSEAGNRVGT